MYIPQKLCMLPKKYVYAKKRIYTPNKYVYCKKKSILQKKMYTPKKYVYAKKNCTTKKKMVTPWSDKQVYSIEIFIHMHTPCTYVCRVAVYVCQTGTQRNI